MLFNPTALSIFYHLYLHRTVQSNSFIYRLYLHHTVQSNSLIYLLSSLSPPYCSIQQPYLSSLSPQCCSIQQPYLSSIVSISTVLFNPAALSIFHRLYLHHTVQSSSLIYLLSSLSPQCCSIQQPYLSSIVSISTVLFNWTALSIFYHLYLHRTVQSNSLIYRLYLHSAVQSNSLIYLPSSLSPPYCSIQQPYLSSIISISTVLFNPAALYIFYHLYLHSAVQSNNLIYLPSSLSPPYCSIEQPYLSSIISISTILFNPAALYIFYHLYLHRTVQSVSYLIEISNLLPIQHPRLSPLFVYCVVLWQSNMQSLLAWLTTCCFQVIQVNHHCGIYISTCCGHRFPQPLVRVLQISFQDVAFLPSQASFLHLMSYRFWLEVKPSRPPHVLELWLGSSKGMLPVKYFCNKKSSFCVSLIF